MPIQGNETRRIFALERAASLATPGEEPEVTVKRATAFDDFIKGDQSAEGTE